MIIPEVRKELERLADLSEAISTRLRELIEELKRRPQTNRAPKVHASMTPQIAQQIRDYKRLHPLASQEAIGKVFNVGSGRVSESLRGKRT